jgi:hypothetical protein
MLKPKRKISRLRVRVRGSGRACEGNGEESSSIPNLGGFSAIELSAVEGA